MRQRYCDSCAHVSAGRRASSWYETCAQTWIDLPPEEVFAWLDTVEGQMWQNAHFEPIGFACGKWVTVKADLSHTPGMDWVAKPFEPIKIDNSGGMATNNLVTPADFAREGELGPHP